MKLKTLKDLQAQDEWNFDTYNNLRQKAIRHIKELDKDKQIIGILDVSGATIMWNQTEKMRNHNLSKIEWIKYFFNIFLKA